MYKAGLTYPLPFFGYNRTHTLRLGGRCHYRLGVPVLGSSSGSGVGDGSGVDSGVGSGVGITVASGVGAGASVAKGSVAVGSGVYRLLSNRRRLRNRTLQIAV